jgi:murein DD-endopeptidase / murein LD-carboxypeptidase
MITSNRIIRYGILSVYPVLSILLVYCSSSRKSTGRDNGVIVINTQPATQQSAPIIVKPNHQYTALQLKYASYLHITPEKITNTSLYAFIDEWMNTPYKWGGTDKRGIDCSAFMQRLLLTVYNINIPRTSVDQFFHDWVNRFGSTEYLAEGDLVFFKTMKGKLISHVGLYLNNRLFINASSKKGVSLGNLDDPYWKSKYVAAGRLKQ